MHKDMLPFFEGIEVFSFLETPRWKATLLGSIEGGDDSAAHAMCTAIERSIHTYPHKDHYFVFGPNSNTYIQWILNAFPDFKIPLPWSALGRNYTGR